MYRFVLTVNFLLFFFFTIQCQVIDSGKAVLMVNSRESSAEESTVKTQLKKGDRILYAQILKVVDQHKKESILIVFADALIEHNPARTRMKIDYILKRERIYLGAIFFAEVSVLEELKNVPDLDMCMKKMGQKYPALMCWSILNADAIIPLSL
jgi:hypothetical protein